MLTARANFTLKVFFSSNCKTIDFPTISNNQKIVKFRLPIPQYYEYHCTNIYMVFISLKSVTMIFWINDLCLGGDASFNSIMSGNFSQFSTQPSSVWKGVFTCLEIDIIHELSVFGSFIKLRLGTEWLMLEMELSTSWNN